MGSTVRVLQDFQAAILAETAAPENDDGTGGTSFVVEVLVGDENKGTLKGQLGRVVLCLGDPAIGPGKRMRGDLNTICTLSKTIEAHLWVPIGPVGERNSLLRYDALEALEKAVLRAWHATLVNANSIGPATELADGARISRDEDKLRNGQAEVMEFTLPIPVNRGRTVIVFPPGATGVVTIVANPPTT